LTEFPDSSLLAELETVAAEAAGQAGRLLAGRFGSPLQIEYKDDRETDPATDADLDSQKLIAQVVASRFPQHAIVGEEDSDGDAKGPVSDFVWVVDPLDGTKNFLSDLPVYASSVGVLYRGVPVAGAIHVPWPAMPDGVVFTAHRGGGAFRNDERLSVFQGEQPKPGLLTALPGMFPGAFTADADVRMKLGEVRNLGSIAYDMVLTAEGTYQFSMTSSARIWDVAAGVVIVQEAGGVAVAAGDFPRRGLLRSRAVGWQPLESFAADWEPGEPSMERLRKWSLPVVLGNASIVRFVTSGLRRRSRLARRLSVSVRMGRRR